MCTQPNMLYRYSILMMMFSSLVCRTFSLPACYRSLALCSSLTSLTIDLPGDQLLHVDHAPLGQLTNLRNLALCYELPTEGQLRQVAMEELARLTKLQQLTVKGFVPLAAEEQQHQSCLPASLTSLIIKGGTQLEQAAAQNFIEQWLQHAAGCSNLQQLINLYWGEEDLDLGGMPHLKELRFVNSPSADTFPIPSSITKLVYLEVLWLGTLGSSYPWEQHYWENSSETELLMHISEQCPMLRQLGPLFNQWDNPHVPQPFKHLTHLGIMAEVVPPWLDHIKCPSLLKLTYETGGFVQAESLQQLARLSCLTCLQLKPNYGEVVPEQNNEGWGQLDVLAAGLCNLQRLELVNHFAEPATPQCRFPRLSMPGLSAFTQLKQLRLACAVKPDHPLPEQLTAADLVRGLSRLTQLEQLELIGYVAVTPTVVNTLIERLHKLLVLEVRRCEHPEVQVAVMMQESLHKSLRASGLLQGFGGYDEVQELYRQL